MTLFRSLVPLLACVSVAQAQIPAFAATSRVPPAKGEQIAVLAGGCFWGVDAVFKHVRSEEHTSELQSRLHLVCRLLLEKKKNMKYDRKPTRVNHRPASTSTAVFSVKKTNCPTDVATWHLVIRY